MERKRKDKTILLHRDLYFPNLLDCRMSQSVNVKNIVADDVIFPSMLYVDNLNMTIT